MNIGKTLFAQLIDFLPWSTFDRIVARYEGNRAVRKLSCAAQYQIMAFAQLTVGGGENSRINGDVIGDGQRRSVLWLGNRKGGIVVDGPLMASVRPGR